MPPLMCTPLKKRNKKQGSWTERMGQRKKMTTQRKLIQGRIGQEKIPEKAMNNSIDDSNIRSCCRIHYGDDESIPERLWSTAKKLGVNFDGREQVMVKLIEDMEVRDNNIFAAREDVSVGRVGRVKKKAVVDVVRRFRVDVLAVQETKMEVRGGRWAAYVIKEKMKLLKGALRDWNREVFGIIDERLSKTTAAIQVLDV
ncbi:hypothetical protein RIF29_17163 [Crotalaria pallida]|uniref:Uncharacterized protein n=1 Tax=Crotalaria pallida TaxID=3830 RepID=A0AAN9FGK2_CROPI